MKRHPFPTRAAALLLALLMALSLTPASYAAPEDTEQPPAETETTQPPTTSAEDRLQLSKTSEKCYAGQYQNKDFLAPAAKVLQGERDVTSLYTITYAWKLEGQAGTLEGPSLRTTPVYTGKENVVCVATAAAKDQSGRVLSGECVFEVEILPSTAIGATIGVQEGAQPLSLLKDLSGQKTVVQQLTQGGDDADSAPAITGIQYISFDLSTQSGTAAGRLGAMDGQRYYLNEKEGESQLSQLIFTPAAVGTYTVNFLAYGDETYYGRLELVVLKENGPSIPGVDGKTLTCDSAGMSFTGSDFYDAGSDDPVLAVRFGTPSAGRLIRGFAPEQEAGGEFYYTDRASDGSYHISTLTYLPTAGYNGIVTLPVTCVTRQGQTNQRNISINVETKDTSAHFRDVTVDTVGAWAADAIDFAYGSKLVSGVETGVFAPNDAMTRGMLVTVLYRVAGSPAVSGETAFTDLDPEEYYYKPVLWASSAGVVNGVTADSFCPDQPVSRQQIAAILYRYAKAQGADMSTSTASLAIYADAAQVEEYAKDPMLWAVVNGIISGTSGDTLSPLDNATRAQVVVMLHRYLAT